MSYNLMAEGDLDLFELSQVAAQYAPGAEAVTALRSLVAFMWSKGANVFDLYAGERISTPEELGLVLEQIGAE